MYMLSAELKEIYSNYEDTRRYYETIEVSHPNFNPSASPSTNYPQDNLYPSDSLLPGTPSGSGGSFSYYLINEPEDIQFELDDSTPVTFEAYPFSIVLPEKGSDQQDIRIVFDNVSLRLIDGIERANESPEIPIKMTYRVYRDGSYVPQTTPIILDITSLSAKGRAIEALATRPDLYARMFPYGKKSYYDPEVYKGLKWM